MKTYKVLSIDAWRDSDNSWFWNNWYSAGEIDLDTLDSNRHILSAMREHGFLSDQSKGLVSIEDDQYNIVIKQRSNNMPLFAIEYGNGQ